MLTEKKLYEIVTIYMTFIVLKIQIFKHIYYKFIGQGFRYQFMSRT